MLRVKLKYVDKWISARIANAKAYNRELSGIAGVITPELSKDLRHTFNYYTVRIKKKRQAGEERLAKNGIASAIYYPLALHLQPVYKELGYKKGDFPVAERYFTECLSLPLYPSLAEKDQERVISTIKYFFEQHNLH